MATYASRSAWELRTRTITSVRVAVPAGIGLLVALSLLLRTRQLGLGYWIDEGLSVGIADRPLSGIPQALRMDGSPPLYYLLLHLWIGVFGPTEAATHALSLLFSTLAMPVAWWAARATFGPRAGWFAFGLAALNPFLTQYAQETRMYALVALLGLPACACFLRAFVFREGTAPRTRRPWIAGFAASLAALSYTHNWALFFVAASVAAWLGLLRLAPPAERRELVRDGLLGFGGAFALYLPWLPTTLYQATHTGAPWSRPPGIDDLLGVPGALLGAIAQVVLLLTAGGGLLALLARHQGRLGERGRAVLVLAVLGAGTITLAWIASQVNPAWANRYLVIGLAPFLLICAAGLAANGRMGLIGLALVAALWIPDGPPNEKSNVRAVSHNVFPSLRPGDLVVATQPEQVPVLHYYLPKGVKFATLTGAVKDVGVTDWRDGVPRLEATTPEHDLAPLLDALPAGARLVLVEPITYNLDRWSAPWTQLIRIRSQEWRQFLSNDPRFEITAVQPSSFTPPRPNPVRATVLVKTA